MDRSITLPSPLYERLVRRGEQLQRTPERLVVDLVQRYLSESDERWQADFQALLARIHSRTHAFSPAEIEADISSAAAEARELRRAHRSD